MTRLVRKLWPLLVGFCMFLAISALVQMNVDALQAFLGAASERYGMAAYVLIATTCVMIPFASILPFIPLAVTLWGWQATAILTLLSWTIGAQIVFEVARRLGKPLVLRLVSPQRLAEVERLVDGRSLPRAIALRVLVHGDLVSYAFGVFTDIGRLEFLLVSIVGLAPAAFLYAYFGSMPLTWQITIAVLAIVVIALSMQVKFAWPRGLRAWRLRHAHA